MQYKIIITLAAILILAAGCNKTEQQTSSTPEQSTQSEQSDSSTSNQTDPQQNNKNVFTMQEVAQANSEANCFAVVDGSVYNLTDWISKHPGGAGAIKSLCGTDGTETFTKQHGSNEKAKAALANFLIGELAR